MEVLSTIYWVKFLNNQTILTGKACANKKVPDQTALRGAVEQSDQGLFVCFLKQIM